MCVVVGTVLETTVKWAGFPYIQEGWGVQDMAKMLKWDLMTQNLSSCQWGGMFGTDQNEV